MQGAFPPSFHKGKRSCNNTGGFLHFNHNHELLREIRIDKHREPFPLKDNMTSGPIITRERVSVQETRKKEALVR